MSIGYVVWLVLCGLAGLVWLLRHRDLSRALHDQQDLSSKSHLSLDGDLPRLTVFVAAKDEEDNIEACVRSLVSQDYPDMEIVAANDRSEDRTGEILDCLAEEYPDKLKVIHMDHLDEGWFGKHHAMHHAVSIATGQWFCFVDADCRQTSTRTMTVAMGEVLSNKVDFLSVLPVLVTDSFWERVIQPVCAAIMAIWYRPERVNDPSRPVAYANGAFILVSRETYDAIGGHAACYNIPNEDLELARLAKHQGHRLFVIGNEDLYVTRMYSTFMQAWHGWSRIFWGSFATIGRLFVTILILLVMSMMPLMTFLLSGFMWLSGGGDVPWGWLTLVSGVSCVILESVIYRFNKVVRAESWAWMTYPVGISIALGMMIAAMIKRCGLSTTTWRGTSYSGVIDGSRSQSVS